MIQRRIDFELQTLRNIRRSGLESRVKENAAVSIAHAFKSRSEMEIFIIFSGLEIAVIPGLRGAVNDAIFNGPFFLAHRVPASEVSSIEQLDPLFIR